jgi:hypothetical protein
MFFYNGLGANVAGLRQNATYHNLPTTYDSVGDMLGFVLKNLKYGKIDKLKPKDLNWRKNGVLRKFSQLDFVDSPMWSDSGLAAYGYVYYPN